MEHPARVEEEREGGTGPRGRDRGGEGPPGVAVWVAEGIIRVVLGVADSPCGCGVGILGLGTPPPLIQGCQIQW